MNYNIGQQERTQYTRCPKLNFQGGHVGGLQSCAFCAGIFRSYRRLQHEIIVQQNDKTVFDSQGNEIAETEDCLSPICAKIGWCTCQD